MQLIPGWNRLSKVLLLLLLVVLECFSSHMLHYMHLKKFLTAVAFARALGKKPTILPVPIPIPIPIAQNEVIKIPMGKNEKTTVVETKGTSEVISHLLGGGSGYSGSSAYGYSVPGFSSSPSNSINMNALKGADSNVINLATALAGSGNGNGPTKIIILGGGQRGPGNGYAGSSPSVTPYRGPDVLNMVPSNNIFSMAGHGLHYGGIPGLGLNGIHLQSAGGFGELEGAYSSSFPNYYHHAPPTQNIAHFNKPRRRYPPKHHRKNVGQSSFERTRENANYQQQQKKPIPVGERYGYRP